MPDWVEVVTPYFEIRLLPKSTLPANTLFPVNVCPASVLAIVALVEGKE